MTQKVVPVQVNKVWEKRHTHTDYSGTSSSTYIPTAEVIILTSYDKREVKLANYPRLKRLYGDVDEEVIGERVAAVLDEDGEIVVFGESKESLMSFEEEEL